VSKSLDTLQISFLEKTLGFLTGVSLARKAGRSGSLLDDGDDPLRFL
jgi:hypothetical protein